MEFICLFLPTLIGLIIYKGGKFKNSDFYSDLIYYLCGTLVVNFSVLLISKIFSNTYMYLFTVSFSIKYILIATFLAILYSLILKKYKKQIINFSKKVLKIFIKKKK